MSTFCSTAEFILKTNDDIHANIFEIIEVLLVELSNSKRAYACENMGGNKPIRENNSIWYVSKEEYPKETYPDFCSGVAYLVRTEDALKILSISNRTNVLWMDDVFVTGILRETYNQIFNSTKATSLKILTVYNRYHLNEKNESINWCSKGFGISQLTNTFIVVNKADFVRDMFCIWKKILFLRNAMDAATNVTG